MARGYSAKDAKQLIQAHRALSGRLQNVIRQDDALRADIARAVDALTCDGAMAAAVADMLENGRMDGALSQQEQHLICLLHAGMQAHPAAEAAAKLQEAYGRQIDGAAARLKPATGALQWLVTSRARKAEADAAYADLDDLARGEYARQIAELEKLAAPGTEMPADFADRRAEYRAALLKWQPEALHGGEPVENAAQLLDTYAQLMERMDEADQVVERIKGRIRRAVNLMQLQETGKRLRGIPVEELGRERGGIRFKSLRDAGYQTVEDAQAADAEELAEVHGISLDTAAYLKSRAEQYAQKMRTGVKIRISADDRSAGATRLVSALCEYRLRMTQIQALEKLRGQYGNPVTRSAGDLQRLGNGLAWTFAGESERRKWVQAFGYLTEQLQGEFAESVEAQLAPLLSRVNVDAEAAWADFQQHTVVYFTILDELVPGVLGNDDGLYGLPEALAKEIQAEVYDGTGMNCTLRRYQEWGVKYILHQKRVLLGDEMGLGKTIQAIAAMVSLRNSGATHFIVVCPASVQPNWCKEIAQKSDLKPVKVHGQDREEAFERWKSEGGVAVTTYETTGFLDLENDAMFDMLVVDEAHYIKNAQARRTVNVKRIAEHAERILFMTGTALENRVDEMLALVRVLQPTVASQLFDMAFMASAPQFREMAAPVYYRRKREDVLTELPDMIENLEWCALGEAEKAVYEHAVRAKKYADIRRVSWSAEDLSESCKAMRMKEIIEAAEEDGRKVIVFSFFLDTIAKVQKLLGDRCMPHINGSVPPHRRQQIIDEFDKASAGAVLPAQIQSGGTGLNIQTASVVILCEPQLKPSIENQAVSRAYRMGQARNVLVYRLLCEDTIDEKIMELLADKQAVFDAFADSSAAAAATARQEAEVDEKTFGQLVEQEIVRLDAEQQKTGA